MNVGPGGFGCGQKTLADDMPTPEGKRTILEIAAARDLKRRTVNDRAS